MAQILKYGLLTLQSFFLLQSTASACPFCHSDTARKVREEIFNADFTYHLLVAVAPFSILAAVLWLIYFGAPASVRKFFRRDAEKLKYGEAIYGR